MSYNGKRSTAYVASLIFFFSVLAVAFHHHHPSLQLPICSLCKVKSSISAAACKVPLDSPPVMAFVPGWTLAPLPRQAGLFDDPLPIAVSFQSSTFSNKAPPVRS